MKSFARALVLGALLSGAAAIPFAAPATAQKKEKKDDKKGGGLKLSPDVLKAAQVAQPAIGAKDFATAEPAVAQIETAAKTDDDKYIAAALRLDLESQKIGAQQAANPNAPVNETVLAAPLDALITNPSTPADVRPRYTYRRGVLSFNSKQYPQAIQYFNQAKELGYQDPNLDLQIVKAKVDSGDVAGGMADLGKTIDATTAAGQKAPEDYYRYAIARSNAAKLKPQTLEWLKKYVAAYPSQKTWRDVLVTYGIQQNPVATLDNSQRIDLYRLMRASGALADQYDYIDYARKVFDRGLPFEAQAVLQEGLSSGKIPASSTEAKASLAEAQASAKREGSLATAETRAKAAADGKLAASTADVYLGQGTYAKAAELYRTALTKGGVNADEVNTRLGIALARSGDKAGAKAAFAAVQGTPRSDIAGFWTTWVDQQA